MPVPKDRLHGTLDALVLKTLTFGPRHGYGIVRWLREQTGNGVPIEEGSVYPALYRMERDGWIAADWGTSELGRKAKVYSITSKGRLQLRAEAEEFASFVTLVAPLLLPT
ncbi:MAG: PadR family transcriptional regulator [Gemmatimonadaceae bacterium]